MIKQYHAPLLLACMTHFSCGHNHKLDSKLCNNQKQHVDTPTNPPIVEGSFLEQAIAFSELMEKFVHALAFGNSDIDLMHQHVVAKFPQILTTSPENTTTVMSGPSSAQAENTVNNKAIEMYKYMIQLVNADAFKDIKQVLKSQKKLTHTDPNIIAMTETLINTFISKFPDLLMVPDQEEDIPLGTAILQDQTDAALRFLNLLEQAKLVEKAFKYQNNDGNTPLMFMAFSSCEISVLEKMLELGADKTAEMEDGNKATVIHYCVNKNKAAILDEILNDVLKKHGGTKIVTLLTQIRITNETPLDLAAKFDVHHDCLKILCRYWVKAAPTPPLPLELLKKQATEGCAYNNLNHLNNPSAWKTEPYGPPKA